MKTLVAISVLALALAGTAADATAPSVATAPASAVHSTTATLHGSVTPNGQQTSWWFEYGTSTSYGLKTATKNAGSGTKSVDVTAALSKLTPGTTIHYRLVASNPTGTSYGGDQSFALLGAPGLQTFAAQNVSPTSAVLSGTVNANGAATTWYFDYGTTSGYGLKTATQTIAAGSGAQPVSVTVSNLSPLTTYHYRLVASNANGTVKDGDMSFSTPTSITMAQTALRVVAGQYVRLSGSVFGGQTGVALTIRSQPFGESVLTPLATVYSGADGTWTYLARPLVTTTFQASANGGTSPQLTIGVQPAVSLHLISGARFSTRVTAASSFAGKIVQFQRSSYGRWVTVKRERLNASGVAYFSASLLPRGKSAIRIALSVNEAGPGYLAGFSRTLAYVRG